MELLHTLIGTGSTAFVVATWDTEILIMPVHSVQSPVPVNHHSYLGCVGTFDLQLLITFFFMQLVASHLKLCSE